MSEKHSLQTIINNKTTISSIIQALDGTKCDTMIMTKRTSLRLLTMLKEEADKTDNFDNIARILNFFSTNQSAIKQMSEVRTHLPFLIDKLIQKAVIQPGKPEYMKIVKHYLSENPILKTSLCFSIQEYILKAIDSHILPSSLIKDSLEVLVSSITHHPDNRIFFIKHTQPETLNNIFKIIFSAGDPMTQLFGSEFLWRIAVPMKSQKPEMIQQIFGDIGNNLTEITASDFRSGIINFVIALNSKRTDPDVVVCSSISKLYVGDKAYSEGSIILAGTNCILLWSGTDMIAIPKREISAIWHDGSNFTIKLTDDFDTLTQDFSNEKFISFFAEGSEALSKVCEIRFPNGDPLKTPFLKKPISQTPQVSMMKKKMLKKNIPSKSLGGLNDEKKTKEKNKSLTPKISIKKTQEKIEIDPNQPTFKDYVAKKITSKKMDLEKEKVKTQKLKHDEFPTIEIDDISLSYSENEEVSPLIKEKVISPEEVDQKLPSEPELPEIQRKDYVPEGWEMEIFDEFRSFADCIKGELITRENMVKEALESTASSALNSVLEFVKQCDDELNGMRNDFNEKAETIYAELESKQTMVSALGEQQCDHIDDMIEECSNIEKRLGDFKTKIAGQKKVLLENQQKHVNLFKEDLKSELSSKRTTKRTRNTKKSTEILNSLLNEL